MIDRYIIASCWPYYVYIVYIRTTMILYVMVTVVHDICIPWSTPWPWRQEMSQPWRHWRWEAGVSPWRQGLVLAANQCITKPEAVHMVVGCCWSPLLVLVGHWNYRLMIVNNGWSMVDRGTTTDNYGQWWRIMTIMKDGEWWRMMVSGYQWHWMMVNQCLMIANGSSWSLDQYCMVKCWSMAINGGQYCDDDYG